MRFGAQHGVHLLGVGLPVGGQVQVAAGFDVARQAVHERALDQAALVVAALVPGVGEEDVHAVQALFAQHVVEHLDRIVAEDADVFDAAFADQLEQGAHAGLVHLAADEVVLRAHLGDVGGGAAHAKADFHDQRGAAAKGGGHIQRLGLVVQQVLGAVLFVGAGLAGAGAPGAQHIALDDAHVGLSRSGRRAG